MEVRPGRRLTGKKLPLAALEQSRLSGSPICIAAAAAGLGITSGVAAPLDRPPAFAKVILAPAGDDRLAALSGKLLAEMLLTILTLFNVFLM